MPPRYTPNDEPDKLDSDPVEAATPTGSDQSPTTPAAVDDPAQAEPPPE